MSSAACPEVGVVVVNWNGAPQSRRCLDSIAGDPYAAKRVCLVDNGSTDDSAKSLQRDYPHVDVIPLPKNLGYGGGCNAGIAWAIRSGLDYVLLLNNDTVIDPAAITTLVARASSLRRTNTDAILAPQILYASQPSTVWSAGGSISGPWLDRQHVGMGDDARLHRAPAQVKWASGCSLFCSIDTARRIGPFDERYFMYLEDVEWCLRARRMGVQTWYTPEARLWHDVSLTARQVDARHLRYYFARNYYLLAFQHGGLAGRAWATSRLAITLAKSCLRSLFFASYRRDSLYHSQTRAILDFLRGRFGPAPYPVDNPFPLIAEDRTGIA
jgi:GT2 family glycosyltransferase